MDDEHLKAVIRRIVQETLNPNLVPIGVSNHHVHLSQTDFHKLFPNQEMTVFKHLKQHADFASNETVDIVGPKGEIDHVRVLGPYRKHSQVEIARSETFQLGVDAPVRLSGNLDNTPTVKLRSANAEIEVSGVIVAKRHIHMSLDDAKRLGVKLGDTLRVEINGEGERKTIFDDVVARPREDFILEMHIDTDEANAANVGMGKTSYGKILVQKNEK